MSRWVLGAAAGAAALAASASAAEQPGFAPGATLPAGALTHPACQAAMRYVTFVDARRFADIGALFAPNGAYYGDNGEALVGPTKIAAYYAERLTRLNPGPMRIAALIPAGPRDCYLELLVGGPRAARPGDGGGPLPPMSPAVDRFTLARSGKVARLYLFFRPPTAAQAVKGAR